MNRWLGALTFALVLSVVTAAAAKGPEVDLVDNKLSINAEAIPLGRLIQLIDLATGMKSKVPTELAKRNVSVKFTGLDLPAGFRKMFQGLPVDYIVVQGQGIIITAASQAISVASGGGNLDSSSPFNPPPTVQPQFEQPFVQDFPPAPTAQFGLPVQQQPGQQQVQPAQPAMVQTPFGPIPNPRAQQQQPTSPLTSPGQNSLFPQAGQGLNTTNPNQQQGVPGFGNQVGNPTPFGQPSPFGTLNTPGANQTNPFGQNNNTPFSTSPFSTPGLPVQQQR